MVSKIILFLYSIQIHVFPICTFLKIKYSEKITCVIFPQFLTQPPFFDALSGRNRRIKHRENAFLEIWTYSARFTLFLDIIQIPAA